MKLRFTMDDIKRHHHKTKYSKLGCVDFTAGSTSSVIIRTLLGVTLNNTENRDWNNITSVSDGTVTFIAELVVANSIKTAIVDILKNTYPLLK